MKFKFTESAKVKVTMTVEQLMCIAGILNHVRLSTNGNLAQKTVFEFLHKLDEFSDESLENFDAYLRNQVSDNVIITNAISEDVISSENFAIDFKKNFEI